MLEYWMVFSAFISVRSSTDVDNRASWAAAGFIAMATGRPTSTSTAPLPVLRLVEFPFPAASMPTLVVYC